MATLRQRRRADTEARYTLTDVAQWMTSGNAHFPIYNPSYASGSSEAIGDDFCSYVQNIYKRNGVVAACMTVRESIFAEIRFRFAAVNQGKLGKLFGTPALGVLEHPFGPNSTTGDLSKRMIQDADLAGQFYAVSRQGRLWRRRPDKMVIVLDGDPDEDEFVNVAGYSYYPHGVTPGAKFFTYLPEEVCHWTPKPDPEAEYRGMSWLTPIIREIRADGAATDHKLEFFDSGASPKFVIKTPLDVMTREQFNQFREDFNRNHTGKGTRYRNLYLAAGADVAMVGTDLKQLDFSETQGRDETRICSMAGVPPVIVGVKESLQGSSLNQGNYGMARRRLADGTMRPLYRDAAGALGNIVRAPQDKGPSILWYDDSQVAFFREDRKDAADIQSVQAQTIKALVDAGYEPDSAVDAVMNEDMTLLKHSGLYSVQLQPAGAGSPPAA